MVFLLIQILILQQRFPYIQFLQIPMTIVFSCFIDFVMFLLSDFTPELYFMKIFTLTLGCFALAMGVALQMIGNVVMLAGEGLVYAFLTRWNLTLGRTKTFFDSSLVIIAATMSWFYFQEIRGIREGTLISALVVGMIARFYISKISILDEHGRLIFSLSVHKKTKCIK
jgi:hypothetical protein